MFASENLILENEVELYNNIATVGDCEGRLQVRLKIQPAPQILWDFEILGDNPCLPKEDEQHGLTGTIAGYEFVLDDVHGSITNMHGTFKSPKGYVASGAAAGARIGKQENDWDRFVFYLPNARCLVDCMDGSQFFEEYRITYEKGQKPSLEGTMPKQSGIGGGWRCSVGNGWSVTFDWSSESKNWVETASNQGTFLTARGLLFQDRKQESSLPAQQLRLIDARERIGILCYLLSFANGGYLGPIVLQATILEQAGVEESFLIGSYLTTPLELLGTTWLFTTSNLCSFISCLPAFERMLGNEEWKEAYGSVLNWYFQAIQPTSIQVRGRPWQVVANALGAALERLSVTILKHELGIKPGNSAKDKIENLLAHIGVLECSDGDKKNIAVFIDTRNDATHPKQKREHSKENMMSSLQYAKLWIEEAMLWRLGYDGAYRRRIPGSRSFVIDKPRYDLNTRNPDW